MAGKAYADVCDAAWAAPEVARLEELRLSVVEARCEAQLQLGEHHSAVAELEMHVRAHPLREHGCELLALALYRAGRQAEALGMLRATRAQLVEGLGIDPGAVLQQLEHDILTHARELDWHPPESTRSSAGAEPPATAVPATVGPSTAEFSLWASQRVVCTHVQGLSEVLGRQAELAALRAAFTDPARLGPDDRHTLLARINLARWTGEAGNAETARELAAAAVEDTQRALGPITAPRWSPGPPWLIGWERQATRSAPLDS